MTTTADLGVPLIAASQAQPEITHNEMVVMMQAMQLGAIQVGLNTPPGSPTDGDTYVTGSAPTDAWASWPNRIASYQQGQWRFVPGRNSSGTIITMGARQTGLQIFDRTDNVLKLWNGSAWVTVVTSAAMNLHFGQRSVTGNTTPIAFTAAVDPTLATDSDYDQITGVFNATPDGENNGITQQTNSLTIQRNGVYEIKVWGTLFAVNACDIGFRFAVNGTLAVGRKPKAHVRNNNASAGVSGFGFHEFAAGDVITLWAACTASTDVTITDMVFAIVEMRSSP